MGEIGGAMAGVLSSMFGGTAIAATRYLAPIADPFLIGTVRFGIGFLILLPIALATRHPWPVRRDLPLVAALGLGFFTLFPAIFNAALVFTTAARGAIALSTIPLQTMLIAAALRIEPLTARKSLGVAVATAGVAVALADRAGAPPGAWRGDAMMLAAGAVMSLCSIAARGVLRRSSTLTFNVIAMLSGTALLAAIGATRGSFGALAGFGGAEWLAALHLGVVGGAVAFFLWSLALRHSTPTLVAVSVTVNPITASLAAAAALDELISWNLGLGLAGVIAGIWLAVVPKRRDLLARRPGRRRPPDGDPGAP